MKKYWILFIAVLLSLQSFAQKSVNGIVKDNNGVPLMGVTVLVKNSSKGTITDFDGKFVIEAIDDTKTLVFSFMGFETKEVDVGNQSIIVTSLKPSNETLNEVVVIGYGSVQKSDLTGAVSSVKPEQLDAEISRNVEGFLQGRVAGVQVSSLGHEPGAPSSIKIRGLGSLSNSTEPLYVIDGVIVNSATEDTLDPLGSQLEAQQGIGGVNPSDIASIQVLKDASATAIYGSRGSNGVIIITTKKGYVGKAKISFSALTRVGQVVNNVEMLELDDYVDYRNMQKEVFGGTPNFYRYSDGSLATFVNDEQYMLDNATTIPRLEGVNWADETYRTSIDYQYRLSAAGGSDSGNYYIAGGFSKNEGSIAKSYSNSGNFVINLNQNLSEKWKLNTKVSATFTENSASKGTEGLGTTRFNIIKQIQATAPIRDYFENFENSDIDDYENFIEGPSAWITDYDDLSKDVRVLGSLKLDYKISDVFTYRLLVGVDYRTKQRQVWYGNALKRGSEVNGEAGLANLKRFRYNVDNTVMFKKNFGRTHKLNGTIGVVFDQNKAQNTASSASGFANHSLRANGIQYGELFSPTTFIKESSAILSFISRLNYTLHNKYLFTATFRADGSSKFAKENRYSYFPAFAFGWKVKEENFLKNTDWLSDTKLRIGWGLTGNQNLPNYRTVTPYGSTQVPLSDGMGGMLSSLHPLSLANPDLIWETTSQFNAGLDLGFVNNKINLTIDAYHKEVRDLLLNVAIGPSNGFENYYANQGTISNKGLEIALSANVFDKKFKWDVFLNFAVNRNKIKKLGIPVSQYGTKAYSAYFGSDVGGGGNFGVPANIFIEGMPAGLFYGYQTDGIINNEEQLANAPTIANGSITPQLGDVMLVDQNGDGLINASDKLIIGDPNPDYTYGFGSNFSYEIFYLNFFMTGVSGNDVANGSSLGYGYAGTNSKNISVPAWENAWSPENPNGTSPRVGYTHHGAATGFTDRIVEDGSFLRLSTVSLGCNLPTENLNGIDALSISLIGQNLFLISDYSGYDPEVSSFRFSSMKVGVDWNSFPNQRRLALGINLSF